MTMSPLNHFCFRIFVDIYTTMNDNANQ